ncbi:CHAT domain-containing protein [Suillus subluteus]|nr:CHAT domain-containing protein [Suillus subluteus]
MGEWCVYRDDPHALDEVISRHYDALEYYNTMHPSGRQLLGNLSTFDKDLDQAITLQRKMLALYPVGNGKDLDEAIALKEEALALFPVVLLSTRFHHQGNVNDLDDTIRLHREALALCPVGNAEDLDEAIALQREVLPLHPVSHACRSGALNNLDLDEAVALHREALYLHPVGNVNDLDEAIALHREALALCPVGHTDWSSSLNNLVSNGEVLALHPVGHTDSLLWVCHAAQHRHNTDLEAYATSMQLLDAYMSAMASVPSCHSAMKDFPHTLAVDAAACALRSGDVHCAVELLEQGRTVIWTQMTRLCTPLDSLQTHGDHAVGLIKRFRDLSSLLDKPPNWNRAVEEIRKIEGFSCFLLPPLFSDLQDAAHYGPIIMLIASKSSCNAIIILHKQPPTKIPLPTNLEKLQTLAARFQCRSTPVLTTALAELWDDVVHLVYRKDGQFLSQIFISSYTPLLTTLIKACRHDRSLSVSFAAIGQDRPAGASFTLECVEPELELDTEFDEPFNSAFLMCDQPLSLLDITHMDLSRHQFAFLSACETAVSDFKMPDEVIHLAAGLQFTGVKSVIGTLWEVNDSTVQCLVEAFYKNLCGDGKMNFKRAARALHKAVQSLACNKDMPLEQHIVFVHIGI